MSLFCDGTLDVDHVLADIAHTDARDPPLPETVLDTLTAAPAALRFSSPNWSGPTAAYREAVCKRGTAFVRGTFTAAAVQRCRAVADAAAGVEEADVSASGVPNPRALL